MTNGISEIELKELLKQYEKDSKNIDLINLIALGYYENPQIQNNEEGDKTYDFFKLAYETKKTVKTIHNYAWYLDYEYFDVKNALKIQKECIKLKPKSNLPYLLYGELLISNKNFKEARKYFDISLNKKYTREGYYNVGYCEFMLGNYEKAKNIFMEASKQGDDELKALFSLAVTYYKLGEKERVYKILDDMKKSKKDIYHDYDIGILYYLYDDFKNAAKNTINLMNTSIGISIDSRDELWYSILKYDKKFFDKKIKENIAEYELRIQQINDNHKDYKNDTKEEKEELLKYYSEEISKSKNREISLKNKPEVDVNNLIVPEYYGCSLFDCKAHGNPKDDG